MPEGDNILRYARVLGAELTGKPVDRLFLHDLGEVPELVGQPIEKIEARGKQMLVSIGERWTLRVHLGMHGGSASRSGPRRPTRGWMFNRLVRISSARYERTHWYDTSPDAISTVRSRDFRSLT